MIRIGTSGWDYPHWTARFYPPTLPHGERLAYYARHFDSVEINRSYYRLPTREQFAAWAGEVASDPGFVFAVKASRYITHLKKLRDAGDALALLVGNARGLGAHVGPFLYQLPPHWHADPDRLAAFVALLPPDTRNAFEFRDPSWLDPRILDILRAHDCALVTAIGAPFYSPLEATETGPFRYLRFHTGLYGTGFTEGELAYWASRIAADATAGLDVYAYFNNDPEGHAVRNAGTLRNLLTSGPAEPLLGEAPRT